MLKCRILITIFIVNHKGQIVAYYRKGRKDQVIEVGSFHRLATVETLKRYEDLTAADISLLLAFSTIMEDYGGYFTVFLGQEYSGYHLAQLRKSTSFFLNTGLIELYEKPGYRAIHKYKLNLSARRIISYYVRCMNNVLDKRICSYNPDVGDLSYSLLHFRTGLRRKDRVKKDKRRATYLKANKKREQKNIEKGLPKFNHTKPKNKQQ